MTTTAAAESTRLAKSLLRTRIASTLRLLNPHSITSQSEKAINSLLQTKHYKSARRLSIYLSMPATEIQTRALVLHALREGKRVFVPYVAGRKEGGGMRMLGLRGREDYEGLERDRWGIPSLKREGAVGRECADGRGAGDADADGSLDLVVMPGVAFDGDGRRLGHGKGYYDRFLTSYAQSMEGSPDSNSRKMPRLVGLALNEQFLPPKEKVPTMDDDWLVDTIVTGDGLVHER